MKKLVKRCAALLLSICMAASMAGCSGEGKTDGENTAPQIDGVADQTVEAGSTFDALAGVTATDAEDGDLTGRIIIDSTPSISFQNGKGTPETAGSYELTYSVTDDAGATTEAYATLTVTKKTSEPVLYKEFDFTVPQSVDAQGWEAGIGESASATGELRDGAFVFEIASPGDGDGEVQLKKSGLSLKAADYRLKVWVKSTADTYAHILARDENADGWSTFGGAYNLRITQEIAPLELYFTSPGEGSAELLINLGRITPNPDNLADTTPDNFTVTIDKIELYEISGEEYETPVYENDLSAGTETDVTVSAGDGSNAAVTMENGAASVNIENYPTDGGVWSIKTDIALPGVSVEEGQKYYFRFKVTAESAQSGECLVESATLNDANRANFADFSIGAGEEKIVSGTFTAGSTVSDPVIRLQIGNPSDGVSANKLVIDDISFGKMEGDLETKKTIYSFSPYGKGTANETNPDYPWLTFNGTDEDNDLGVGTIWSENGSLFYRIDQGGITDWHNKLVCGYTENPLTLEADSYYTVELTVKATENVSCGFFLNPLGTWDPRVSEGMDITTEEQTFTFTTTDTFLTDMGFEMLLQFGSDATASLGEVTIEFSNIRIMQMKVE